MCVDSARKKYLGEYLTINGIINELSVFAVLGTVPKGGMNLSQVDITSIISHFFSSSHKNTRPFTKLLLFSAYEHAITLIEPDSWLRVA